MIIIAKNYGQLGNRLFLFSHFIAAAAEHGVQLANPCFAEYADFFESTKSDLWCRFDGRNPNVQPANNASPSIKSRQRLSTVTQVVSKALHLTGMRNWPCHVVTTRRWEEGVCYDLGSDEFRTLAQGRRHFLARGWMFRNEDLFQRHAELIRRYFAVTEHHRKSIDAKIAECRSESDLVVGVHIRQGDYKKFLDGKYYYTTDQYADQMHSIADQLPTQKVTFLVCGNGQMSLQDFRGLNVQFGPGHMVEDMYSLAETDLMIGPPSTFTGWAAFIGNKPRVEMESATQVIDPRIGMQSAA